MHLFLESRRVLFHCPSIREQKKSIKRENHRLHYNCSPQFTLLVVCLSNVYLISSTWYFFARFWAALAGSCSRILAAPFASNKRLLVSPVLQNSMQCFVAQVFALNDRDVLLCLFHCIVHVSYFQSLLYQAWQLKKRWKIHDKWRCANFAPSISGPCGPAIAVAGLYFIPVFQ
jgi:hypothetical protein